MPEIEDVLRDNIIPRQSGIDDVGSSASPVTYSSSDGYVEYVNPGGGYEDSNITVWDKVNNVLDCKNLPLYAKVDLLQKATINVSSPSAIITVKFVIPRPVGDGGEIVLDEIDIVPKKQGIDYREHVVWHGYAGALVKQYGVKSYAKVSDGSVTVSNRSLLARV